jgi:hypothetical protein
MLPDSVYGKSSNVLTGIVGLKTVCSEQWLESKRYRYSKVKEKAT